MKARPPLLGLLAVWLANTANLCAAAWPNGPFKTSGRWITDASGANVAHVGVNWPGHGEAMIPEGLQYQSISAIVSMIKSLGMNAIRLTYATQMIDQLYDNGESDITIEKALIDALGRENGSATLQNIIKGNPSFSSSTTRLQVFDAVAAECAKQEVYVLLDNHVSKAGWCCNPFDGNSWWGDNHFSPTNWTRGLAYMAKHGKSWPALTAMSLRNEPRQPLTNFTFYSEKYNWETWYTNTKQGAAAVHAANPDVLILLSGMDSDTQLDAVVQGKPLAPGTATFNRADFPSYADKLVLELHTYNILPSDNPVDCPSFEAKLFSRGFETLTDGAANQFPLVMTEFGFAQDAAEWNTSVYATCLREYLPKQKVGWFIWVIAGSYYIREGKQDSDEVWGLLTHDWSRWRSPGHVEGGLKPMVNATLAGVSRAGVGGGGGGGGQGVKNGSESDGGDRSNGSQNGGASDASRNSVGLSSQPCFSILAWASISVVMLSGYF